jgi:mRNA interferase MazF
MKHEPTTLTSEKLTKKRSGMIKKCGEVYRARLDDAEGHEQKGDKETGYRPVVIVSNNQQNTVGKIFVVVPLTSKIKKLYSAFQVPIFFRGKHGRAKCEQVRVIDAERLGKYKGKLTEKEMLAIKQYPFLLLWNNMY